MGNDFITLESGLRIHFKEFGRGPTLLLIHGWNNDLSGFTLLIKHLESNFRVIAIDLPGYGKSQPLDEDYSVEKLSDVVSEFIFKKEKKIDVLCALSMGSVIAVDLSRRYPERIKSIVLIGPPIIKYDWKLSKLFREWIRIMNKNVLLMKIGHMVMASNWYGHFTAKYINMHNYNKNLINKYGMKGRKRITSRVIFQMGKAMYSYHLGRTLKETSIPILMILGRYDKIVNLSQAARIVENKKNIKLAWVEESGHVVSLEKPEQTARLVKEFASTLKIL